MFEQRLRSAPEGERLKTLIFAKTQKVLGVTKLKRRVLPKRTRRHFLVALEAIWAEAEERRAKRASAGSRPCTMHQLVIDHVSKRFTDATGAERWAVRDVSLTVAPGELLALAGPSGAGKTTLLRLIAGLDAHSGGTIQLDGQDLTALPPGKRDVAMVFQQHALYPHLTAFENLAFGLKLRRVPRAEITRRVLEAADLLGVRDCLQRRPAALSGGERQRVALGRAWVRQPKLFLLDEPLSQLDAPLRAQLRAELGQLQARLNATMIYVTHDQFEAVQLGRRIAVLDRGSLQQVATPETLYCRPANLFVAGFMFSPPMNHIRGTLHPADHGFRFVPGGPPPETDGWHVAPGEPHAERLAARTGSPVVLGLRPEDIALAASNTSAGATVPATVEHVLPLGAETHLHCRVGAHRLLVRLPGTVRMQPSEAVELRLNLARAHWFDPATESRI